MRLWSLQVIDENWFSALFKNWIKRNFELGISLTTLFIFFGSSEISEKIFLHFLTRLWLLCFFHTGFLDIIVIVNSLAGLYDALDPLTKASFTHK